MEQEVTVCIRQPARSQKQMSKTHKTDALDATGLAILWHSGTEHNLQEVWWRADRPSGPEDVNPLFRTCEIRMDFKMLLVADRQQRRVLQVFAVIQQLQVRRVQVFMLALVLPCEMAALPNVGKALAVLDGRNVLLKGEAIAGLIGGGGMWLAQDFAQVDEMGLRGGPLGKLAGLPTFDKFW